MQAAGCCFSLCRLSLSFSLLRSKKENSEAGSSGAPPLLGILFEVVPASDLMMHFQICALQKHARLSSTFVLRSPKGGVASQLWGG